MFDLSWFDGLLIALAIFALALLLRWLFRALTSSRRRVETDEWDAKISEDHRAGRSRGPARPETDKPAER
ncbi:hypothetical protein [Kribbella sp. CA-293567]|uniref:hypothetical protein n=1 Tax=Kribbella sp. CA-293567 TaxID=3002436 RepID=UPI0022DDAB6C|nr:hypothetical protein [Kribbella sp. CA-293567]WBQ03415.1 hypothetical protein OX958_26000 [Kribbella sp. CA-293567]